jgi:hypothetical protein
MGNKLGGEKRREREETFRNVEGKGGRRQQKGRK